MLHLLPVRTAGAAENMARDFLLLQRYPHAAAARFRHYEWRAPACTFGYSQRIAFVRANLPAFTEASEGGPPGEHFDLCRRPTGGGIVDHRHDWTYALVLPRGHALYDERAAQSYRVVHECLAEALVALGQPAEVKRECESDAKVGPDLRAGQSLRREEAPPQGICFQRAELYDVVHPATGAKIAGAAQKRNKHGLLFQGSIDKGVVRAIDWETFHAQFAANLAAALSVPAEEMPWPELNEDEVAGLIEQYSSPEWIEFR